MAIFKKQDQRTEARLLLESSGEVELPPAEVDAAAIVMQFEQWRPFLPELLETLRAGTIAEPVPVMNDAATFAVHGRTRTFWVKIWHASVERTRIERVQVLSCLPLARGTRVIARTLFDEETDGESEDDE
ncbi:MAG: hypothetical protein IRZ19_06015 [Pyrinomonas methylaliphatogenes]|jgi:hypothetical protein|nr:hypothetical protein [Pyrinomonas methylaliphatogenes]